MCLTFEFTSIYLDFHVQTLGYPCDYKQKDGKYEKKESRRKKNLGKIFKSVEVICYAAMFQDVGNSEQEINKKKKRKKNPGWVAQKIFLNTESEKKG